MKNNFTGVPHERLVSMFSVIQEDLIKVKMSDISRACLESYKTEMRIEMMKRMGADSGLITDETGD